MKPSCARCSEEYDPQNPGVCMAVPPPQILGHIHFHKFEDGVCVMCGKSDDKLVF